MYLAFVYNCVLTIIWTVLQAKVQRPFSGVRIWTIMSGTLYVFSGGARVWNWLLMICHLWKVSLIPWHNHVFVLINLCINCWTLRFWPDVSQKKKHATSAAVSVLCWALIHVLPTCTHLLFVYLCVIEPIHVWQNPIAKCMTTAKFSNNIQHGYFCHSERTVLFWINVTVQFTKKKTI